jgi:hypothetical protein
MIAASKHIRTFRSKKLHPEHAKLINEAIRKNARGGDHNVHISYTKADGTKSDRKVRPLAVKGKSLFVAHCHERNAIRSFKVERIDMIKKAFWDGFEKRASDKNENNDEVYKWHRRGKDLGSYLGKGVGGAAGGIAGILAGEKAMPIMGNPSLTVAAGGTLGAAGGALIGNYLGKGVGGLIGGAADLASHTLKKKQDGVEKRNKENR